MSRSYSVKRDGTAREIAKKELSACSELYWENFLYGKEHDDQEALGRASGYSDAVWRLRGVLSAIEQDALAAGVDTQELPNV